MPIKVRKFNAQVRDPESGQMVPAGLLSSVNSLAIYTTNTLPVGTSVFDGVTVWCSDIKMPLTYYNEVWYKPDGTALES